MATVIADAVGHGSQSWIRKVTAVAGGHKIRVVIDRDSYDRQSSIYSEVWSPSALQWNRVESRSGVDHADLLGAYEKDEDKIRDASEDLLLSLLDYAEAIVDDSPLFGGQAPS